MIFQQGFLKKILLESIVSPFETILDNAGIELQDLPTNKGEGLNVITGELVDIDPGKLEVRGLPNLPQGTSVSQIDVVIRIK